MMDNITLNNIETMLKAGKREDGRGIDDFRNIEIETGIIEKAEGSAKVRVGKTEILVGVKILVGEPFSDTPNQGVLMTGAELTAMSNDAFESGPPGEDAIGLARVVDRTIREGQLIDVEKLCIKEGEKVWMVYIDIYSMNFDGNAVDAATLGAVAALATAKMPEYDAKTDSVNRDNMKKSLPINGRAVSVTLSKIADAIVVDATEQEEKATKSKLTVGVKDGRIVALQMGGDGGMSDKDLDEMLERAIKQSKKLLKYVK
jgi:exosome complex component RRP42